MGRITLDIDYLCTKCDKCGFDMSRYMIGAAEILQEAQLS